MRKLSGDGRTGGVLNALSVRLGSPGLNALSARFQAELPDDFLVDDPEGVQFQRAFARSGIPGFSTGCVVVERDGQRIAVAPVFTMQFSLATMLPPGLSKKLLGKLRLSVVCVGHPSADIGRIDGDTSPAVLAAIASAIESMAPLLGYKGFGSDLCLPGFVRVRGLPVPVVPLDTDPFTSLPSRHRNQIKRKRSLSQDLRWETVQSLPTDLVEPVYALYLQTFERAKVQFEKLTPSYFSESAELSEYILAFEGDRLLGFAQLVSKQGRTLFKYVGMDYARGPAYGLYFGLLIRMVEHARSSGHRELDFGVTAYDFKRKLGARMHETCVYYKHRNPVINQLLRLAAPLLEPGPDELL